MLSFVLSPSIECLRSVLGNDFGKYAKDRGLKIDTDVVLHEGLHGRPMVVGSATISGTDVSDPDAFQRRLNSVDLSRGSGSVLIVISAVVIHKESFSILYPYEFHWTSMDEVLETLGAVSKYGFYV